MWAVAPLDAGIPSALTNGKDICLKETLPEGSLVDPKHKEKITSGIRVPNQHQSSAWIKHCPVGGSCDLSGGNVLHSVLVF